MPKWEKYGNTCNWLFSCYKKDNPLVESRTFYHETPSLPKVCVGCRGWGVVACSHTLAEKESAQNQLVG